MAYATIPLGERDGRMYLAHEVENGKKCGCHCPACQKPLVAANQGRKRLPYFRHAAAQGCEHGRAEGIRRAAVQLIAEHKRLLLPGFHHQLRKVARCGTVCIREVQFPATTVVADKVERFVDLDGLRAHALITVNGSCLVIRIKCSSRHEHKRWQHLQSLPLASLEMDLHQLTDQQINDKSYFAHAVLNEIANRRWIRSLRAEKLEAQLMQELASQVEALDQQWQLQEQARLEAAEARRKQLAEEQRKRHAAEAAQRAALHQQAMQKPRQQPPEDYAAALAERKAMIVATMFQAAREWAGKALQCTACRMLNSPDAQVCQFCDHQDGRLELQSYPQGFERTIHLRMRTSVAPENSLRNVPVLKAAPPVL